jgi:hypothetical protein
MEQQTVEVRF